MMAEIQLKVLLVENEKCRLNDIFNAFESSFFQVTVIHPETPLSLVEELQPDIVFLEYSISDMSGILFFKKIVSNPKLSQTPTIFVSDSRLHEHRLHCFEIGASGFLSRPITNKKLTKATQAYVNGRKRIQSDETITIGNLLLNPNSNEVRIGDNNILLTKIEFKILHCLLQSTQPVLSRAEICEYVWGENLSNTGRFDTQLYNLKKKLRGFDGVIKSVSKIGLRILVGDTTSDLGQTTEDPTQRHEAQHQ